MVFRINSLLVALAVVVAGLGPLAPELSAGDATGHACCRAMQPDGGHRGCGGSTMRCCGSSRERGPEPSSPPASAPASHGADLTLLKGPAAHVPGLPALASAAAAHAFVSVRLNVPPDPLYIRHLVLIV
jgi:hypothetical protein